MTWLGVHSIVAEFFGVGLDEERVLNKVMSYGSCLVVPLVMGCAAVSLVTS